MKTWNQLTPAQQDAAVKSRLEWLLNAITEGMISFTDPVMSEAVLHASEQANRMRTPWFMSAYLMDSIGETLTALARAEAEEIYYLEPGEAAMFEPIPEDA